jgi:hypothetical protein
MCTLFNHCVYEAAAFSIRVVDKDTGEPLADVHALASWLQYGLSGQYPPLIVLDSVSGPDGILAFPAWGPIKGSRSGVVLGKDPIITLFKPGYLLSRPWAGAARVIHNAYPRDTEYTTRVRRFGQDGKTFTMEPFRGTPQEWLDEISEDAWPYFSDDLADKRPPANRLRRLWAEREKFPARYQMPGQFFWHVERSLRALEGDGQ